MDKDNFNANVDFVRGQADMIVLSALSDTGKYGLEILNTINERSKGMYSLKQATLYSSLKRLEKNGYVHSYDGDTSNGAKRVYYGLTQMGREYLENDKSYWEFCNFLMSNLISDNKFDPDSREKPFDPAEFRPLTRRARGEKDDKEQVNEQDKEKEVVVKYVYVKSEDIPEGADIVYVSPENIQDLNSKSIVEEKTEASAEEDKKDQTQEITTLSDTEYQPSFILVDDEDDDDIDNVYTENVENERLSNEVALVEESANEVAVIKTDLQVIEENSPAEESTQIEATTQAVSETQAIKSNQVETKLESTEDISDNSAQEIEPVENYAVYEETSAVEVVENNNSVEEVNENVEEATHTAAYAEEAHYFEDGAYYNQESAIAEESRYEDNSNSFASRPLHNSTQGSSVNFSSLFSNYSRENDVNYVESFSELFDVDDEEDLQEQELDADIEFMSMKEMVYKYQSKGINIKPYDKKNTMEYYVNRYYFSNKLQFHASLIIFAIFALEFFIGHFICNRGANKVSDLWLLMIFALAIFPAIRSVMYVIDPTRKSLANYNPKTSFLISLLPVVTFPIVFALMGFVQFGANIDNYESMERAIILPSVLLFNVPLFSIIYTLLYRTYKYHVN